MNDIDKKRNDDNPQWQIAASGPDWIRDAYRLSAGQARSFLRTALVFGAVDPAGSYGMHWILALFDREGAFRPYIGLGI